MEAVEAVEAEDKGVDCKACSKDYYIDGQNTQFCQWPLEEDKNALKTVSPKRVVTIVLFTTISGHFLANPFNIFHKT